MTVNDQTGDPEARRPTLHVLFVEDSPRDAKLTAALLDRAGYALTFDVVDTIESLREQLKRVDYEIIISDYNLGNWTAMEGLGVAKETGKDIPFIVVSGSLGDEAAAECIKQGATDFVLKDRMARLPAAINSALRAKALRQEHKRAEEALRSSEERYRLLFECHPHPMWVYDTETLAFVAVNDTAVQHYGYSREEFHKMQLTDIRPAEDVPLLLDDAAKANAAVHEDGVRRHRKKDGSVIYVEVSSHTLPFGRGNTRLALANDITERKRIQQERERFFSVSRDLLCVATFEGYFTQLNPAWEKALGFTLEELQSKPFLEFVHPEDRAATLAEYEKVIQGMDTHHFESRFTRKDGSYCWLAWSSTCSREDRLFYGAARDVTEQRRLEEQLSQSSKMEAIGQLAGGVAHDFNNLLTIINGYSDLVLEHFDAGDPIREHVEQIMQAGDRAASLTRQLLAFGRRQVIQPQLLDLNTVLANTEKMLRRLIGEDIDLLTARDPALGRVRADPGQIEQIILNLAVNARDAMPQGGKLTLESANIELDDAYIRSHATVTPGLYVMLAVSDTGIGMDARTKAHIFEPFFTTKEKGKGTGLGLATVYGIVKQTSGHIWVYSEPGKGTTFKIYLPRVGEAGEAVQAQSKRENAVGGSETILLVEDEVAVRKLAAKVLQKHGYKVLESTNVEDALLIGERHQPPIDLLLTDVVMPRMGGRELSKRIATLHPETKTLYMSGYTENGIVHHGVIDPGTAFLQKPFTPEALAREVRTVLDAGLEEIS